MNNKPIKHNYGYLCGIIMLLVAVGVTALIIMLSFNEITTQMGLIFARDGFFEIIKGLISFLGDIPAKLKFGRGMTALSYVDGFCLAASILGFVQGALFKKRDLIA